MRLPLMIHSALALFAQRTRIPTSARSIGFWVIWVCISSSSSSYLVMLVLLERDNFCVNSVISLTSYAVVCSNVVVHNSDQMVAIVDYYILL